MKPKINCILLIDDDKLTNFVNKVTIDDIECADYIIKKESVPSAIKYITDSAEKESYLPFPDVIFLDIEMLNDSGWNFLDQYKKLKKPLSEPYIFMLTSFATKENKEKFLNYPELSGFYDKPLTSEMLNTILEEHFVC